MSLALLALTALGQEAETPPPAAAEPAAEPAPAAPAPVEPPPDELDELRDRLEEADRTLAEQQAALEDLRQQVAEQQVESAKKPPISVAWEGHYRVRGMAFDHLWASQTTKGDHDLATYTLQRLWLRPRFELLDGAGKLFVEVRALEDVVFGDNAGLASTPLFAVDPSTTDVEGDEIPTIGLGRVWMEARLPIGVVRAGRQPSIWGMGLLVGGGDAFDQPFGDSYYPSTNDRILFATRPLAILSAVLGKEDREIPFYVAIAADKIVEDPLFAYYGYTCDPGVASTADDFDPRCDSDGDGVTDLEHSYVAEEPTSRTLDWWADSRDDVSQMVYVLTYQGKDIDYLGGTGDLGGGFWIVNRRQRESDSNVLIVDAALRALVHHVLLEGELISITGETRGIALPDATAPDPLFKQAGISGYAARAAYVHDRFKLQVETGFASGDEDVLDADFSGRPLHPDHNVGLLLYEEVLAAVTAVKRTESARGLWSNGGVYSSRFVFPTAHVYPAEGLEVLGGFVMAWPDAPDGAILRCRSTDKVGCATPAVLQATSDTLGWEVDLGVKARWAEDHLLWSLEGGYAKLTDRIPFESVGLDPGGEVMTLQSRLAWIF